MRKLTVMLTLTGLGTALICAGIFAQRFAGNSLQSRKMTAENPDRELRGISRNPRDAADLPMPLSAPRIVVKKSERKLFLYSGDKLVRTYRIGLGLKPTGDKVQEGDRRTPEGDFYIFTKNDKSAYYLSLGLSYPNAAHAQRGLRD